MQLDPANFLLLPVALSLPAVKLAREVLGPISTEGDTSMGYGSRCLYHTAAGFLQLSAANVSSDERADAKQHFSRALKMAHKHLHNHQVVSQLLMMMAPLQVGVWHRMQWCQSNGIGGRYSGTVPLCTSGATVNALIYVQFDERKTALMAK